MSDILVTTPAKESFNAAQEARDCLAGKADLYFRRFVFKPLLLTKGSRVFYVDKGAIRGYAIVDDVAILPNRAKSLTDGKIYAAGAYVYMRADSWKWISPISYKGFQGYRYVNFKPGEIKVIGDWKKPYPKG